MGEVINVVITEDDGRKITIGVFDPIQKYLLITRNRSKHFFRKLNAWGIDEEVFLHYKSLGLVTVILHEREEKKTYVALASDFLKKGTCLKFRHHRKQIFLPEEYWQESN